MQKIHQAIQFFRYLIKGKSRYYIHSPFVFSFINNVLNDKRHFYAFDEIEKLRKELLHDDRIIQVSDFGAGHNHARYIKRSVKSITQHAAKSKKWCELLYRATLYYKPKHILEFGTSLGISAMYLSASSKNSSIITMEGCENTAAIAQQNFKRIGYSSIKSLVGEFDLILEDVFAEQNNFDLIFIDGNHRKDPTLKYFEMCLLHCDQNSVLIFDDIHWSNEMTKAWEQIRQHPSVSVTIDLYQMGFVFLHPTQAKENFILYF